mgnify:CR=1 FL=1
MDLYIYCKINSIETPDNSYLPSGEGYSIGALFALKTAGLDENGIPMFWKDGQKVSFSDFYGLEVNTCHPHLHQVPCHFEFFEHQFMDR